MKRFHKFALSLALALAVPCVAMASPCEEEITRLQVAFNQRLDAAAEKGPSGAETTDAKLHHQPTQQSLAAAEAKLGDITPETAHAFDEAMQHARAANGSNDQAQCRAALQQARQILAR